MHSPPQDALERLLSNTYGTPIRIARAERLAPWFVLRARVADPAPGVPESVIVKWLRQDPSGFRTDPQQVATEQAALEFLSELSAVLAPKLLASDREGCLASDREGRLASGRVTRLVSGRVTRLASDRGLPSDREGCLPRGRVTRLLVLEDLAPRIPLAELLREKGPEPAMRELSAYARATGRLHAATVGRAETYYERRRRYGPVDPQLERQRFLGNAWVRAREWATAHGAALSHAAERDLARLLAALADPGPFLAFSNGDAGENNFLVDGDDGRIIDFEFAGYRHALTDAAWIRVPGPFWITAAGPHSVHLEAEYRRALAGAVPEATDDRLFGFGLAAAYLAKAIERVGSLAKLDARQPGHHSRPQRVATLEAAAEAADAHRSLPQLAGWTRKLADLLRRRWPDADIDYTVYRSYTPRE